MFRVLISTMQPFSSFKISSRRKRPWCDLSSLKFMATVPSGLHKWHGDENGNVSVMGERIIVAGILTWCAWMTDLEDYSGILALINGKVHLNCRITGKRQVISFAYLFIYLFSEYWYFAVKQKLVCNKDFLTPCEL